MLNVYVICDKCRIRVHTESIIRHFFIFTNIVIFSNPDLLKVDKLLGSYFLRSMIMLLNTCCSIISLVFHMDNIQHH